MSHDRSRRRNFSLTENVLDSAWIRVGADIDEHVSSRVH
jgi:hypothetical protein